MRVSEFQPPEFEAPHQDDDDRMYGVLTDLASLDVHDVNLRDHPRAYEILDRLMQHAYAEGRKDEREELICSLKPVADVLWSDPLSLHGRVKWLGDPAPQGAFLYTRTQISCSDKAATGAPNDDAGGGDTIAYKFQSPNGSYWYIRADDYRTIAYWRDKRKLIPLTGDKARIEAETGAVWEK